MSNKLEATYGPGRTAPPLEAPDLSEIRDAWVDFNLNPLPRSVGVPQVPAMQAEFNRAMDAVRAEALREFADEVRDFSGDTTARHIEHLALARADNLEQP